jgi:pimeloyl-ACP methyl ester carboxylesterase
MEDHTALIETRSRSGARAAVVFVHGFSGTARETWGRFPILLAEEPSLIGWDIFSLGYATSLRVDVPNLWAADPPLARLSLSLRTALRVAPLARYETIALVAHSMGGLLVQHAVLDRSAANRVGFVVLFGTPSRGLYKALIGLPLKRQTRDMFPWSRFMLGLRWRWWRQFGRRPPFELRVVAGERDEFVPPRSSLLPFAEEFQRVVPGNHLEIVKPLNSQERSVQLVIELLTGSNARSSRVDSVLLAIERREFNHVVEELTPIAGELDQVSLVALALALDAIGREGDAIEVLEKHYVLGHASTDVLGVLGGRIKRRWLAGRRRADWQRARDLYESALAKSAPADNPALVDADQAMYHAINIAFLDLMASPVSSAVPPAVRDMTKRAQAYAEGASKNHWQQAVLGDAACMLGDISAACQHYTHAREMVTQPREIDSMYGQAVRIAARVHGASGAGQVESCFCLEPVQRGRLSESD